MTVRILRGDCRDMLRTLPDESVHTVVTSPPYWGLRDYGLPPSMWGGDPACEHEFGPMGKMHRGGANGGGAATIGRDQSARDAVKEFFTGQICGRCGAWHGCLGLEPTPQMFVEHLVEVFREVHRVLRADGTVWLNLGDSYATGAGKVGDHPGGGEQGARWAGDANRIRDAKRGYRGSRLSNQSHQGKHLYTSAVGPNTQPNRMPIPGLKPKDLVMVPARCALALQADGWWVRQDIIWSKPNPMPESVLDRCTKSHEYLFLLSKSERYYFDAEAIKEPASEGTHQRRAKYPNGKKPVAGWATGPGAHSAIEHAKPKNGARKLADAGYGIKNNASFDEAMAVMPEWRNKRSVWTVTTQPFKEAHFATFPPALIEPCILAGSPRGGAVLDPFGGAGTTGLVADQHGRDAILIELNPQYADMAQRRIAGEAPLFSEVVA